MRTSSLYRWLHWASQAEALLSESDKWHEVTLRLWGDGLPVDEIAGRLGLEPTKIGRRGEPFSEHPKSGRHRNHIWLHRFTDDPSVPFDTQLEAAVTRLEAAQIALHTLLSVPDVEGDFALGFGSGNGQGGDVLSSRLLARIGALGLSLSLDLYPPDIDTATRRRLEEAT